MVELDKLPESDEELDKAMAHFVLNKQYGFDTSINVPPALTKRSYTYLCGM